MQKLLSLTIWGPDAIPPSEWKYRNQKRVMFPIVDFLFFMAGVFGVINFVPGINRFFPDTVADFLGLMLALVALLSLLGVIFPKLWPVEMVSLSILFGLLTGYCVSLLLVIIIGESDRWVGLFITLVALCIVAWRISILGTEWQIRRVSKKTIQ